MSDEKRCTDSEVWRQAYNAALAGTLANNGAASAKDYDSTCALLAQCALESFARRWPR